MTFFDYRTAYRQYLAGNYNTVTVNQRYRQRLIALLTNVVLITIALVLVRYSYYSLEIIEKLSKLQRLWHSCCIGTEARGRNTHYRG